MSQNESRENVLSRHGLEACTYLPKGYLSYSQISRYLRCPKQYELSYVEDKPFETNENMILGSCVHKSIEWAHKEQIGGVHPTLSLVLAKAETVVSQEILSWENPEATQYLDGMLHGVVACLKAWWGAFGRMATPVEVEKEIVTSIEGVPFVGYVDLVHIVNGNIPAVLDYKTMERSKGQAWVDENLQLWLYAALLKVYHIGIGSIIRPKGDIKKFNGTSEANFTLIEAVVPKRNAEHALRIVADVAKGIQHKHFPRTMPGEWWCTPKWCQVYNQCRGDDEG